MIATVIETVTVTVIAIVIVDADVPCRADHYVEDDLAVTPYIFSCFAMFRGVGNITSGEDRSLTRLV